MMPDCTTCPSGGYVTTAIRIPRTPLALLRQQAVERATRQGCRVSVSGVLIDLARGQLQQPV